MVTAVVQIWMFCAPTAAMPPYSGSYSRACRAGLTCADRACRPRCARGSDLRACLQRRNPLPAELAGYCLASGHGHDKGEEGSRHLGPASMGPVGVGRAERQAADAPFGADDEVRAREEVRCLYHGICWVG